MQFTMTHLGVPVGSTEFALASERIVARVHPLPGYAPIQILVRTASLDLAGVVPGEGEPVESIALQRGSDVRCSPRASSRGACGAP